MCYRDLSQPSQVCDWLSTGDSHVIPKSKTLYSWDALENLFTGRLMPTQSLKRVSWILAQIWKAKNTPPILTVKSSATMQFRAARSLWTNLLALRYAMPSAISPAIWIILLRLGGARTGLFCWRLKKKLRWELKEFFPPYILSGCANPSWFNLSTTGNDLRSRTCSEATYYYGDHSICFVVKSCACSLTTSHKAAERNTN